MFLRYLPFSPGHLSFDFLSSEHLQINAKLYLQSPLDESADKAILNNTRVHNLSWKLNLGWKLDLIQEALGSRNKGQKPSYLVGTQEEFERIRTMPRFENISQYSLKNDSIKSLYTAFLLLRQYPNNNFLRKSVSRNLFRIARYKNLSNTVYLKNPSYAKIHTAPSNEIKYRYTGEYARLEHFFKSIFLKSTNILALRYVWIQCLRFPEDKELQYTRQELPNDYLFLNEKSALTKTTKAVPATKVTPATQTGKYAKIKSNRKIQRQKVKALNLTLKM